MMDRAIFLVGYMGSGKSTVGKKLAERLGWHFVDTDFFIESRFRKRVADIFRDEGEAKFRSRERVVIEELSGMQRTVIATGGGLPCFNSNIDLLNDSGSTVYLELSDEVLATRLEFCKRTRPSIKDLEGEALLAKVKSDMTWRRPIYQQARYTINVDDVVTEEDELALAQKICKLLGL